MGRELRRKQAKKDGKSLEKNEVATENQIKKFLINILILIVVIVIIYIVSGLFVTKELKWFNLNKDSDKEVEKVGNIILASSIFKQSDEEYYVYFYDFSDKENAVTSIIESKLSSEKIYKVDTASAMNSQYVSLTSNKSAKTLDELKVVSPTLIKISGGSITEYYEKDEIKNKFK